MCVCARARACVRACVHACARASSKSRAGHLYIVGLHTAARTPRRHPSLKHLIQQALPQCRVRRRRVLHGNAGTISASLAPFLPCHVVTPLKQPEGLSHAAKRAAHGRCQCLFPPECVGAGTRTHTHTHAYAHARIRTRTPTHAPLHAQTPAFLCIPGDRQGGNTAHQRLQKQVCYYYYTGAGNRKVSASAHENAGG